MYNGWMFGQLLNVCFTVTDANLARFVLARFINKSQRPTVFEYERERLGRTNLDLGNSVA